MGESSPKNSADFVRRDRQWICRSPFTDCNNSDDRGKSPCACALTTCRKRITPLTETCCGKRSHASVYQPRWLQLSANDGIWARVRTDDGERSEWFDVTQGLRQGLRAIAVAGQHVLAASLHAVFARFSEDEGVVQHLVQLDDDRAGRVDNRRHACGGLCGAYFTPTTQPLSRKRQMGFAKIMAAIVIVRSSRIHGFGKKYGDHAAANTGSCIPGSTVRHRSSRTEV